MFRRSYRRLGEVIYGGRYDKLKGKRLGVFPLHLDPPTNEHLKIFQRILEEENGIDHLTLIPNTRIPLTLQHSLHLAAMSVIATQSLPNVSVDLSALETPDCNMPLMEKILVEHPEATVVHWLPDLHETSVWTGVYSWSQKHPFLLLKPEGYKMSRDEELRTNLPPRHRIMEVKRSPGAENRRRLFDGLDEAKKIVPMNVLRYIDSHGLYRDFRQSKQYFWGEGTAAPKGGGGGAPNYWTPTVAIEGTIPRLLLLHDESNLTACQIYQKLKPFQVRPEDEPDLIVPIGGDGYMMHSIRTHWRKFIPFFGVNAGHVGFLLNDAAQLEELFNAPLALYQVPMLYVEAETNEVVQDVVSKEMVKKREVNLAFNDAWIERSTGQTALINVRINGTERIKRVRGDGVLVSTAAGSTAYALGLGGSPLPVNAQLLQLVGSNVVSPARWKPVHLNNDVLIELEAIDPVKRPCRGFVDSVEIGTVSSMTIRASRVAGVQVAFSRSCDIQGKLYRLQFPPP